jgi:hypothetical protein
MKENGQYDTFSAVKCQADVLCGADGATERPICLILRREWISLSESERCDTITGQFFEMEGLDS